MSRPTSRRGFLKDASATAATLWGLGACHRVALSPEPGHLWETAPALDGALLLDAASRERMAEDLGGNVRRIPAAVLRPRSARDVLRMVQFAERHGLRIVMRGQGHSQYGQALVRDGIAIDSSSLNAVTAEPPGFVYAQSGATWDDVTRATLAHRLTPPAMGDTMSLSVGGILSAGGISNRSHRFGAVIDNVAELDVVTGAGELVPCSLERNRELFELVLGGMGQCGIIVGARLRVVSAPAWVVRRDLFYDDLATFIDDLRRVVGEKAADHLGALVITPGVGGRWRFVINVGLFSETPDIDLGPIEAGLRFASRGDLTSSTYAAYLHREDARNAALATVRKETPRRGLYLTPCVPGSVTEEFLTRIMTTPGYAEGVVRFSLYLMPMRNMKRPLLMMPREEFACAIFLFRTVPIADKIRSAEMEQAVRAIDLDMRRMGGKAYAPNAPFYSAADWEAHYGSAWGRLQAGKRQFDPGSVLTPGMRTFGGPAS